VIGLSAYAEPHYVEAMLEAGAVGHFTKGDAGDALLRAIHTATPQQRFFGTDISVPVAANGTVAPAVDKASTEPLGGRELEILRLIGTGLASAQIARSLSMDPAMVDVYRRNLMRKLNLSDDAALGVYARERSVTHDDDKNVS
jgi:DNA-binding NarL/FixJ family response regulator